MTGENALQATLQGARLGAAVLASADRSSQLGVLGEHLGFQPEDLLACGEEVSVGFGRPLQRLR